MINWEYIQQEIESRLGADVLFILDCCHAGGAAHGDGSIEGLRCRHTDRYRLSKRELLGACDSVSLTPGFGPRTFTRRLTKHLEKACAKKLVQTTDNIYTCLFTDPTAIYSAKPFRLNLTLTGFPIVLRRSFRYVNPRICGFC